MCSTPFGIRDSTLGWINDSFNPELRAQRLSASEIQHSIRSEFLSADYLCSTPFGIRDSTLARLLRPMFSRSVLNAFRHQRFNTFQALRIMTRRYCAQRLSASEIQHITLTLLEPQLASAQRLSASEIQHYKVAPVWSSQLPCSTPFGIRDSTPKF